MGATPNFDHPGTTGNTGNTGNIGNTGTSGLSGGTGTTGGYADLPSSSGPASAEAQQAARDARGAAANAGAAAKDAMSQLQDKASELTSRLINNVDLEELTQKLEQEVRAHPARTLLVALGAGFLLGRSAKR